MIYDIAIIGAGVTGCMIARELSMYKLNVCLLEKSNDVSMGASKANSGIVHAGYDAEPGSLKAKLNVRGCALMEQTAKDLDVPFKKCGSLVTAFDDEGMKSLHKLYERGKENSVSNLYIIDAKKTMEIEPNINKDIKGALYAPDAGIICPYQLTIAAAENAVNNGVELTLNFEVTDIKKEESYYNIYSPDDCISAKYVINAAGVHSDKIASLTGDDDFYIIPRRGEYIILDKTEGKYVNTVIFQPPSDKGKGILVSPTVDGNLLLGPTASRVEDREDTSTTTEGLSEVIEGANKAVSGINLRKAITSFSGIRSTPSTYDFIIRSSVKSKGVFHVAGIESPGLTSAPSIAEYIVKMLKEEGISLEENPSSVRTRKGIPHLYSLSFDERKKYIKENPLYGKIVCRCESISEGEIIDSIRRPVGATTIDGVKRRVRAGMGRCQGGFCMPKILSILAKELNTSVYDVQKSEESSTILMKEGEDL